MISALGASASPISNQISLWWIVMGLLLILFATGFKQAFAEKGRIANTGSWLIAFYGIGEGIGSGTFKVGNLANSLTISAIIHDILSGMGVVAFLIFPLIMLKIIPRKEMPVFYRISQFVFISGMIFIILLQFRYATNGTNFLSLYKGLWQRLFMLNTYFYLMCISVLMITKQKILQP